MLKLQIKDKPSTAKWLLNGQTFVGKDASDKLSIADQAPEDVHVRLNTEHDEVYLVASQAHPTAIVNSTPVQEHGPLQHGDIIEIESTLLEIVDPKTELANKSQAIPQADAWRLVCLDTSQQHSHTYYINREALVGRDASCSIVLQSPHLSRRHARLFVEEGRLHVEDLQSANGCFLNQQRIKSSQLEDGDTLCFDQLAFCIKAPLKADESAANDEPIDDTGEMAADEQEYEPAERERRWITKPTSPGNRPPEEEIQVRIDGMADWVYYAAATVFTLSTVGYLLYSMQ